MLNHEFSHMVAWGQKPKKKWKSWKSESGYANDLWKCTFCSNLVKIGVKVGFDQN